MTLEETVAHHRWCADNCEGEVRDEHLQMVWWLEELVMLRKSAKRHMAEILEQKQIIERQRKENADWEELHDGLAVENIRMRQLVARMYRDMQGVLDRSTDTVWVDKIATLRDCMDGHMEKMAELGMPPRDYESRRRELGVEADDE